MSFQDFFKVYEKDMRPRLRENTWKTKEQIIVTKVIPYIGDLPVNEISKTTIVKWQNELMKEENSKGEKYSQTYLRTIHAQLSSILNHACKYYNLRSNVAREVGSIGKKEASEMKFWTESEYDKFIEEVKDKTLSFYAFEILYWCGLRTGELLALTKEKFDFTNNTIRVNQSLQRISGKNVIIEPKTKKSIRTVVTPDFLAEEMKKLKRLVGWRKEKLNGKVAKLPFSLIDEKANGWNMPERWINFNDDRTKNRPLGFVLVEEDKIVCIDLDHAIQDGKLSLLAKEIIENFAGTYMELSQSAKGIHIFVQGTIPNNLNLSS